MNNPIEESTQRLRELCERIDGAEYHTRTAVLLYISQAKLELSAARRLHAEPLVKAWSDLAESLEQQYAALGDNPS